MLSREEIEKLSELARIQTSEEENEALQKDLEAVLEYVAQVQNVVQGSSAEESPMSRHGHLVNIHLREDGDPHEPGAYTDALLEQAPETEEGYVKVRKVL